MKRSPRTLVIAEVFHPEDFLINAIVREWAEQGRALEVMARVPSYPFGKVYPGYRNRLYQRDHFHGVPVHRLPVVTGYQRSVLLKLLNYLVFALWGSALALLIGRRFDRIFIYHTGPLTLAIPGVLAGKLFRCEVSIWTQDLWPDTVYAYGFRPNRALHAALAWLVRFVYGNCRHIYLTCDGFQPRLARYLPGRTMTTVPNWPITGAVTERATASGIRFRQGLNFTFTGNVGKVQNLENVILGFARFRARHPACWLNIVGDGSQRAALEELVRARSIEGVVFWGRQPVSAMPGLYEQSDALVCPLQDSPIYELTIPLKFQTYLAAGRPVLGIIGGEVRNLIEDHGVGVTAPPGDVAAIADAFQRFVLLSGEERERMGRRAVALLQHRFDGRTAMAEITAGAFGYAPAHGGA